MSIKIDFIKATEDFKSLLESIKASCDKFDSSNPDLKSTGSLIARLKKDHSDTFDKHFDYIWNYLERENILNNDEEYKEYRKYYYEQLSPLLQKPAVNKQIYEKPLGYPGDFVVMNYIYDLNDTAGGLFGDNSFEMFINNYTCNIPIAYSNIKRKEFLKNKIIEIAQSNKTKIASIACGPLREFFELQKEGRLKTALSVKCFDFEDKVFEHINSEIAKNGELLVKLELIKDNVMALIKKPELKSRLAGQDLIYCIGLFDYLGDKLCKRLIKEIYGLLDGGGELIVCNASSEFSAHRAYYEFLGDWNLIYRTKDEMDRLAEGIADPSRISLFKTHKDGNYWFLSLIK